MRAIPTPSQSYGFCLLVLLICALLNASPVQAAEAMVELPTDEQQQLYGTLTNELRCLKCQNQTIADSPAGLAEDLRREIREQIVSGRSEGQIKQYMVDRYGDFILYRPRFSLKTLLLWTGPVLMLIVGTLLAWRLIRRSSDAVPQAKDDALAKARSLLDD